MPHLLVLPARDPGNYDEGASTTRQQQSQCELERSRTCSAIHTVRAHDALRAAATNEVRERVLEMLSRGPGEGDGHHGCGSILGHISLAEGTRQWVAVRSDLEW